MSANNTVDNEYIDKARNCSIYTIDDVEELFNISKAVIKHLDKKPLHITQFIDFINLVREKDLSGPYSILSYIFTIVEKYIEISGKSLLNNTNNSELPLPYPIDYQPHNLDNFNREENFEFIEDFVQTSKINIIPWSYVSLLDDRLNEIRDKYVKTPSTTSFRKSLEIIVSKKIEATNNNINNDAMTGFFTLFLSLFNDESIKIEFLSNGSSQNNNNDNIYNNQLLINLVLNRVNNIL